MNAEEKKPAENPNPNGSQLQEEYISKFQSVSEGQMIPGEVVEVTPEYVFVDVGLKSEGKIPIAEFDDPPRLGDTVYVILLNREGKGGEVVVSKQKADEKLFWKNLRKAFDEHQPVTGKIDKKIKGGFEVDLGNDIRAFVPLSKVDVQRPVDLDEYVGVESLFYVERLYSKGKVNIVVNRREWLEGEIKRKREEFFRSARIGDVYEGTVKSFTSFGAFIDLGGFDGLLHINDMSWRHINSPKEIVNLGQKIELKLIRLDPQEGKINLSLKHFTEDPWIRFEEKYHIEQVVRGTVTKLTDFGVFIELEEGIEGLAHISELSWVKKIRHPKEILKVGDVVDVKILAYDVQQGRLSLGLKQVYANPWDDIDQRYPVGMRLKRKVKNLTNFGAFVELEEGIDGLLHVDDMSWTRKLKHPSAMVKEGEEIEVAIIDIDKENRRIKLGLKQLSEDPWRSLLRAYPKNSTIEGEISSINDFGIFVKVQGDIEGLINRTNIADPNVESPEDVLKRYKVGDRIRAVVLEVNPGKQKLALSLRDYHRKVQEEEIVKYIHDESQAETSSLADFIKEKTSKE